MENNTELFTWTNTSQATVLAAGTLGPSKRIFFIVTRGAINFVIGFIASFLNVSTVTVILKYKELQITSNALVICLAAGNSLAVVGASLVLLTDFIFDATETFWKSLCSILIYFLDLQQSINLMAVMAISIERAFTIFMPLTAYSRNSFGKMMRVTFCILALCLVHASLEIGMGFFTGNFHYTISCIYRTVAGHKITAYSLIPKLVGASAVTFAVTMLILVKLIWLKWENIRQNSSSNSQHKITKMLVTGKQVFYPCMHFLSFSSPKHIYIHSSFHQCWVFTIF